MGVKQPRINLSTPLGAGSIEPTNISVGTEFDTRKVIDNKKVIGILFDFGPGPNAGSAQVPHNLDLDVNAFLQVVWIKEVNGPSASFLQQNEIAGLFSVDAVNIELTSDADLSGRTYQILLEFQNA